CITVSFNTEAQAAQAMPILGGLPFIHKVIHQDLKLHLYVQEGGTWIAEVLRILDKEGTAIQTIGLSRPSLDDVFLQHTGRSLRDDSNG
ncbi:MAG: hypothetical protein RLZZ165_1795, partial [Bacteroidota bacterium]